MRVVRNLGFLFGAELLSKIATVIAVAYLARLLGPDGYGMIEFAGAALLCAGLVVDQGFGPYGARELARAPGQTARLTQEIVTARFVLALLAYLALAALGFSLQRDPLIPLLLIFGLSLFGMPLMLPWVFQGHERMGVVAVMQVVRQVTFAVVIFALVRGSRDLLAVGWAEVVAVLAAAAYGLVQYRRAFDRPPLRPAWSPQLLRQGVPIGLSQMFWTLRMAGAVVVVGLIATAADVGYFASAQRIFIAVHAFVFLYFFNLLPAMTRAWDGGQLSRLLGGSLHLIAWVVALAGGLWMLLSPLAISLMYGPAFAPATSALQWLGLVWAVALIDGHYRFGLIAAGRQTAEMSISIIGAVAALVMIPIAYQRLGVVGAAAALAGAEVVVWLSAWGWSARVLGVTGQARLLVLPLIAVLGAYALISLAPSPLPLQIALFAIMLIAFAWLLDASLRQRVTYVLTVWRLRSLTTNEARDEALPS